jgi:4-diphosphocytidyl-2-C-methyl-D-erythritol kinase
MIFFPNCKINLGLNIVRKRADNYHDLETVFYPLPVKDVLEIIPSETVECIISGLSVAGEIQNNLCVKAWHLLKKDFPALPAVKLFLHKNIPIGAGLGGGSADGAFMLKLLNEKFHLHLSIDQLIHYALQLGSDCPFFIHNKSCFATGRGEILEHVQTDLSAYSFLLVSPGIPIDTKWAFSQLSPSPPAKPISKIIKQPVYTWKEELKNDFETPVLKQHPVLGTIKETLYKNGAVYASMSGSGSSFYGIFEKNHIPSISFGQNFQSVTIK